MAITNTDKPTVQGGNLSIGGGFSLSIGSLYQLVIGAGNTLMTNIFKVSIGETWGTIATSWASETRTWQGVSQLLTNSARTSSSITNQVKP